MFRIGAAAQGSRGALACRLESRRQHAWLGELLRELEPPPHLLSSAPEPLDASLVDAFCPPNRKLSFNLFMLAGLVECFLGEPDSPGRQAPVEATMSSKSVTRLWMSSRILHSELSGGAGTGAPMRRQRVLGCSARWGALGRLRTGSGSGDCRDVSIPFLSGVPEGSANPRRDLLRHYQPPSFLMASAQFGVSHGQHSTAPWQKYERDQSKRRHHFRPMSIFSMDQYCRVVFGVRADRVRDGRRIRPCRVGLRAGNNLSPFHTAVGNTGKVRRTDHLLCLYNSTS